MSHPTDGRDSGPTSTPEAAPTRGRPGGGATATSGEGPAGTTAGTRAVDTAQYGLAAFLAVVGGYVVYDATQLRASMSEDFLPPTVFAYLVGGVLLALAAALAVATARGDVAEAEEGEDIDLTQGTDVRTVVLLALVLLVNVLLIEVLGWAITGAILFTCAAWVLGSRHWVRDVAIGVALSVGTFYLFYVFLGVPLPAGILDGVL